MKEGENGHGISSRWYPDTLATRIRAIGSYAERLDFFQGDGVSLVELCKDNEAAAFFIDPPYTAAGKRAGRRLYTYNEIDHEHLFERMSRVQGVFMMTYDESPDVIEMARGRGFHLARVSNEEHAPCCDVRIAHHVPRADTVTRPRRFGIGEWYGHSFVGLDAGRTPLICRWVRFPLMPLSDGWGSMH